MVHDVTEKKLVTYSDVMKITKITEPSLAINNVCSLFITCTNWLERSPGHLKKTN